MTLNHKINAIVHRLPKCPECGAAELTPCANERGNLREPHHIRVRLAAGELKIVERKPRPPRPESPTVEMAARAQTRKGMLRAVDRAVDKVRRDWRVAARGRR